jgi:hypothetical protein
MRPRWISNDPSPDPPRIALTVIAQWWPGRYLLVSTIRLSGDFPEARLLSSLETGISYKEAPPKAESFVTQVVRCDRCGVAMSWDDPLFEREYSTRHEAEIGHQQAVAQFTK